MNEPASEEQKVFIPRPRSKGKARLVVVESVYHQPAGEAPLKGGEHRFARWLQTDEQVYGPRKLKIPEEWTPLELGWFMGERCGMLTIENTGRGVLELHCAGPDTVALLPTCKPHWVIQPGESFRGQPASLEWLRIRSQDGPGSCVLTIYPS